MRHIEITNNPMYLPNNFEEPALHLTDTATGQLVTGWVKIFKKNEDVEPSELEIGMPPKFQNNTMYLEFEDGSIERVTYTANL